MPVRYLSADLQSMAWKAFENVAPPLAPGYIASNEFGVPYLLVGLPTRAPDAIEPNSGPKSQAPGKPEPLSASDIPFFTVSYKKECLEPDWFIIPEYYR